MENIERDYNQEKIIEKMREIRDFREQQFIKEGLDKTDKNKYKPGDLQTDSVENVTYLGKINFKEVVNGVVVEKEHDVFMISENIKGHVINKVYADNNLNNCLGIYDDRRGGFIPELGDANNQEVVQQLQEKSTNGKINLNDLEQNRFREIARALHIREEDLKKVSELDLTKNIDEQIKNKSNALKDNNGKEVKQLDKEEVKKLSSSKQELKIDAKVDDKETLGYKLGLSGEFKKIAIVYTSNLDEIDDKAQKSGQRYSFVAIKNDGSAQIVDNLEEDLATGTSNAKDSIKIETDGEVKEDNETISRFKIKGKDEYVSTEIGEAGEIKAFYERKTHDGNEAVGVELESSNTRPTPREVRDIQAYGKGTENADKIENKVKEHEEHGHSIDREDINDDEVPSEEHKEYIEHKIEENSKEIAEASDCSIKEAKEQMYREARKDGYNLEEIMSKENLSDEELHKIEEWKDKAIESFEEYEKQTPNRSEHKL